VGKGVSRRGSSRDRGATHRICGRDTIVNRKYVSSGANHGVGRREGSVDQGSGRVGEKRSKVTVLSKSKDGD